MREARFLGDVGDPSLEETITLEYLLGRAEQSSTGLDPFAGPGPTGLLAGERGGRRHGLLLPCGLRDRWHQCTAAPRGHWLTCDVVVTTSGIFPLEEQHAGWRATA